jgi:hypothetical protein
MRSIYIHNELPVTSLVVEGKLVGPWVKELEKCWEGVVAANPSRTMLMDLADVSSRCCRDHSWGWAVVQHSRSKSEVEARRAGLPLTESD